MRFHWQNLNEKKNDTLGSGLRHGRFWWHFDAEPRPSNTIQFCWNLWTHFCGVEVDWDDEDLTLMLAFPPLAFWLSFSSNWGILKWLLPRKVLSPNYPDTIVVDEREIGIRIHDGNLWIKPYCKKNEWASRDPWWTRGVTLHLNPFEWRHMRHDVRLPDGTWTEHIGSWERHKGDDGREVLTYPYRYALKSGEVQERTATVCVERRTWRPRSLRWTSLFEKEHVSIDVQFSDEVGERSGSWKGGCTGCGYSLLPSESPLDCLRRMERERVFN